MKNIIIIVAIAVLMPITAFSQVYVKVGASGADDGTSWNNAFTDIQSGINAASSGEQVWVSEGTYMQFTPINLKVGVEVYGGFPNTGNPNFGDRDYILNLTTINCSLLHRGIYNNGGGVTNTSVLDGFTIRDGNANQGAGLYLRSCSPIIRNCTITANSASDDGGGVYLRDADAEFTNCKFISNQGTDDGGGAYMRTSDATFSNCFFESNLTNNQGGGIYVLSGSPIFNNVTINSNNQANDGAGVYCNNGSSVFTNCNISSNTATDEAGGVYIGYGDATFTNCTIDANTGTDHGGGVNIRNTSTPTFNNCIISNNSATNANKHGGGFYIAQSSNPTITGCTIQGNSCTYYGGGLYTTSSVWSNALNNNQFISNTATGAGADSRGRGAGAYIEDNSPDITNNTFTNNLASVTTLHRYGGVGAGLYIRSESPLVSNNTFTGNRAFTTSTGVSCGQGGAIYFYGSASIVTNNIFNSNEGAYGGAIYSYNSKLTLSGNTYTGNTAIAYKDNSGMGGAIYFYGTSSGTGSTIIGETIDGNTAIPGAFASSGWGGAIYFNGNGVNATLTKVTIQNNTAEAGGGICIDGGADPVFSKNNITGNTATDNGGAIFIDGASTAKMTNCLFHVNTAANGGAFYSNGSSGGTYLNNTIANNNATKGGALFCQNSDIRFKNNILWGNTATNGSQVYLNDGGSDPYFENCDVEGGTAAFDGGGAGGYAVGRYTPDPLCDNQDPLFSDGFFHLTLGTSPCIGTGDAATVAGDFPADEDYDDEKRVRGTVDIGAYETNNPPQFVTLPYLPLTDNPGPEAVTMDEDANPTAFALTLSAIDVDGEDITWSIVVSASNGNAVATGATSPPNAHSLVISYTPDADYFGTDAFTVQVSDGTLIDQIQVNVTINPINDKPEFTSTPTLFTKSQQLWEYNITTSDIDHALSDLTVTCTSKPAGMTYLAGADGTGTLTWTPTDLDIGVYVVTLQVDDTGLPVESEIQTFNFEVLSRFINVPAEYPTIQLGVNAAADGDKVIVAAGVYNEVVNTDGKTIEIEGDPANPANVTIDGGGAGSVLTIDGGGSPTINGFTLTNGTGQLGLPSTTTLHAPSSGYYGGGILIYQSNPTLSNIIVDNNTLSINNNHGGSGAGIYIGNFSTVVINGPNTEIKNNTSTTYRGGAICVDDSDLTLNGTVANGIKIENNAAGNYGGGIGVYNSTTDFNDVLINGNSLDGVNQHGVGIYYHNYTLKSETNVTDNDGTEIKP